MQPVESLIFKRTTTVIFIAAPVGAVPVVDVDVAVADFAVSVAFFVVDDMVVYVVIVVVIVFVVIVGDVDTDVVDVDDVYVVVVVTVGYSWLLLVSLCCSWLRCFWLLLVPVGSCCHCRLLLMLLVFVLFASRSLTYSAAYWHENA